MASSRQPNFGRSNFKLLPSLRRVQSGVPKTAGGTQVANILDQVRWRPLPDLSRHANLLASEGRRDDATDSYFRQLCTFAMSASAETVLTIGAQAHYLT